MNDLPPELAAFAYLLDARAGAGCVSLLLMAGKMRLVEKVPGESGIIYVFETTVHDLPDHHQDPFDRMLIAQSQLEKLPIVTVDPQIAHYSVEVIW